MPGRLAKRSLTCLAARATAGPRCAYRGVSLPFDSV